MNTDIERRNLRTIWWVLLLGTLAVYAWSVLVDDFIIFDDGNYVSKNAHVQTGLTLGNLIWAFTTFDCGNWHPLTWVSHELDGTLFGAEPAGHHLTNLIFHVANTLLLFGVLRRLTGAIWRSALVAALFAWHPLHVESVAWAAERKDVLCAFFGLLSLGAYAKYVSPPANPGAKSSRYYYRLTLIWFACGLLSKPMLVTLPFVLLLLDFWPLRRISDCGLQLTSSESPAGRAISPLPLRGLVLEKIPFFLLTIGSSVVTFIAQRSANAVASTQAEGIAERLNNVCLSYGRYLGKTFFPRGLAIFYPYVRSTPILETILVALILVGITWLAAKMLRQRPYLLFGWLWFLGTLVPAIGLVQVGGQAMADRYTYLPLIGIFVMVAWSLGDLAARSPQYRPALQIGAGIGLAACLALTWVQAHYWRSTYTLFGHAEAVTPPNVVVECQLGSAYLDTDRYVLAHKYLDRALQLEPGHPEVLYTLGRLSSYEGKTDQALRYFESSLKAKPNSALTHYSLGNLLAAQNQLVEATNSYRLALSYDPGLAPAEYNLAVVLVRLGDLDGAIGHLKAALRLKPDYAEALDQWGGIEMKRGAMGAAQLRYNEALAIKPDYIHAHLKMGYILAGQNKFPEAKAHFAEAIRLEPTNSLAHFNLAGLFAAQGQFDPAAVEFAEAARLDPLDPEIQTRLAEILVKQGKLAGAAEADRKAAGLLARQGRFADAIKACRDALQLQGDSPEVLANLAWLLATSPLAELRQGSEAVRFAERAADLGGRGDPRFLTPLDAAYAEAGRFADAIKTAQQAQAAATAANQTALAEQAAKRLELYRAGKPYHQPAAGRKN